MQKNILFLVFGLLIAFSFSYIKTTQGADKTTAVKGILNLEKSTLSIPDNGISPDSVNLTFSPLTSFVVITCLDADGCNITLDDTGGVSGDYVVFVELPFTGNSEIITSLGESTPIGHTNENSGIETIHDGTNWHILQ